MRWLLPIQVILLVFLNGVFVSYQPWIGDFWHHAAIVSLLQREIWPSSDPFMAGVPPLIPYWPYEAVVASCSNILGLTAIQGLALFSFFNGALLLFAICQFLKSVGFSGNAASIFLILFLGCWGLSAPNFSAFLHARVFFYVLSYPSTCAYAVVLLLMARLQRRSSSKELRRKSIGIRPVRSFLVDLALISFVVLSHPISFLLFFVLAADLFVFSRQSQIRWQLALLVLLPIVLWFCWPLFPLAEFLQQRHFSSDPDGAYLYTNLFSTAGFASAGVFFVILRVYRVGKPQMLFAMVLLIALIVFGWLSGQWNYGRSLVYLVLLMQLAILRELLLPSLQQPWLRMRRMVASLLLAFSLISIIFMWKSIFLVVLPLNNNVSTLATLESLVNSESTTEAVFVANAELSKKLPAFGVRALVFDVQPFFRDQYQQRREAQALFMRTESSNEQRCKIVNEYHITDILLDLRALEERELGHLIQPLAQDSISMNADTIVRVRVDQSACQIVSGAINT